MVRHNYCGHSWKVIPNSFLFSGGRCPECSRLKRTNEHKFLLEMLDSDEYEPLTALSYDRPFTLKHIKCGNIIKGDTITVFILSKTKCEICDTKNKFTGKSWDVSI